MISICQPISAGNAIRIFVEPPTGSLRWRVLRKASDTFGDQDDTSALNAYEGDEKVFIDSQSLQNEVGAFYKAYFFNGSAWSTAPSILTTPSATYEDHSTDTLDIVCDRLRAGLLVEVQRQNLLSDLGYIQVYTAPPSMEKDLRFPLVTVSLSNECPYGRGIGEQLIEDELEDDGDWFESEGWLASVQLSVVGWSLNPDERREMRKALRRIVVANLPVFADHGMQHVELSQQDSDAVSGEYGAPIYQVVSTFSCLAPVRVGSRASTVINVEVRGNSNV